jgi:hypothetical protein
MVLNTSFKENEPVVCRPVEVLHRFLRTKMDVLVLGTGLFPERRVEFVFAQVDGSDAPTASYATPPSRRSPRIAGPRSWSSTRPPA